MIKYHHLIILIFLSASIVYSQESNRREYTHQELLSLDIEELLDLDVDVQITSNKGENLFKTSSTVTIINKQTILDYNYQSIEEALQTVAGFNIYNTYLMQGIPTVRGMLQEHYANKVLLLINGIPTFHSITGEGMLDRIDIHDVERIEVLKGPASVLYGSNAYAGAVNIILKTDVPPSVESHVGFGYSRFFSTGANAKANRKNLNIFVSGNSRKARKGKSQFIDEGSESGIIINDVNTQNINFIASYKSHTLFINGYNRTQGFFGVKPLFKKGAGIPQELRGYLTNYSYNKQFNSKLRLKGNGSADWNYRSFARGKYDSIRSDVFGYRLNGDIGLNYVLSDVINVDLGGLADFRNSLRYSNYIKQTNELLNDNNLANRSVFEYSFFGQANVILGKLKSTLGLRYTNNYAFGDNFSPRASLVYTINNSNAIKLIYGESFRAPSLFEMYFINPDSTVFGNPELRPERLKSIEAAFLKSFNHLFFQVIGYHKYHYNKIQRTTGDIIQNANYSPGQRVFINGNKYQSYGIEVEVKYNNPRYFQIFTNYSLCSGNNGDTLGNNNHYNYWYVPKNQLTAGIHKTFKKNHFVSSVFNYWSETNGTLETIPGQYTIDLNIGYKQAFKRVGLVHTLSFKNITNSEIIFPEYVRGNINSMPQKNGFSVFYSIKMNVY